MTDDCFRLVGSPAICRSKTVRPEALRLRLTADLPFYKLTEVKFSLETNSICLNLQTSSERNLIPALCHSDASVQLLLKAMVHLGSD